MPNTISIPVLSGMLKKAQKSMYVPHVCFVHNILYFTKCVYLLCFFHSLTSLKDWARRLMFNNLIKNFFLLFTIYTTVKFLIVAASVIEAVPQTFTVLKHLLKFEKCIVL